MNRKVMTCVAFGVIAFSIALGGCSKTSVATSSPKTAPAPGPGPELPATPKYDWAAIKPAALPPGSPRADILGVQLGMSPAAAAATLACANPRFVLSTNQGGSFTLPVIEHGPQPETSLDAKLPAKVAADISSMGTDAYRSGPVNDDTVAVMFIGLAGHEQAAWLAREERYPEGNLPSVTSTVNMLVQKYGRPTSDTGVQVSSRELEWIHAPSGAPMNPNDPHYPNCGGIGNYGSSFQITTDCGLTLIASLVIAVDGGVGQLDVTMMNQAAANAAIEREKADIARIDTPNGSAGKM